jgi:RNA polymerase sigma-70 factor (ECF subfamily)
LVVTRSDATPSSSRSAEIEPPPAVPRDSSEPPPPRDDTRIAALVHAHFELVWRVLRRVGLPPVACDDAAQQVFLVASRRLEEIAVGAERSFLVQTALRVGADARRAAARKREDADGGEGIAAMADPDGDVEAIIDRKRARAALDQIVGAMDEELRAVFVLFEIEGLAMREISELLGVAHGTVASRLRRARDEFNEAVKRLRARDEFRGRLR